MSKWGFPFDDFALINQLFESVTLCVSLVSFQPLFLLTLYIYIYCSIISLFFSFESSHKSHKCCSFLVSPLPFLFFISIELTSNSWNLSYKIFILVLITSGDLLVLNIIFFSSVMSIWCFLIFSVSLLMISLWSSVLF